MERTFLCGKIFLLLPLGVPFLLVLLLIKSVYLAKPQGGFYCEAVPGNTMYTHTHTHTNTQLPQLVASGQKPWQHCLCQTETHTVHTYTYTHTGMHTVMHKELRHYQCTHGDMSVHVPYVNFCICVCVCVDSVPSPSHDSIWLWWRLSRICCSRSLRCFLPSLPCLYMLHTTDLRQRERGSQQRRQKKNPSTPCLFESSSYTTWEKFFKSGHFTLH